MKLKVKIKSNLLGKSTEVILEKEQRQKDHLEAQQKFKANIFRDKTKYTRKQKYKKGNGYNSRDAFL